jgi:hypothetical protein
MHRSTTVLVLVVLVLVVVGVATIQTILSMHCPNGDDSEEPDCEEVPC